MPRLPVAEFRGAAGRPCVGLSARGDAGRCPFALARHALAVTLGLAPHRPQVLAARVLLDNRLVEMATGEGKTAAIALAAAWRPSAARRSTW